MSGRPGIHLRVVASLAATVTTAAFYSVGIRRAFGYDASVTVQNFVRTPSIWDPWRRHVVLNNHPFFSFAERLMVAATRSSSEVTLRLLPIVFTAAAVGLTVWWLSERWSLAGSLAGGLLMAANPALVASGREVRGYSLLVLCAVVSSAMVVRRTDRAAVVYLLAMIVGATTHLYALALIPCHAAYLSARRRPLRPFLPIWGMALLAAGAAFAPALTSLDGRGRLFRAGFPIDLLRVALGGTAATAAVSSILVLGSLVGRMRSEMRMIATGVALVLGVWIWAPYDLYPRFFLWAVPLLAMATAVAISRHSALVWVGAAAVVLTVLPQLSTLGRDDIANRAGARLLAHQPRPCALGWSGEAVAPYGSPRVSIRYGPSSVSACGSALVLLPGRHPDLVAAARRRFARVQTVRAGVNGLLFSSPRNP